MNLITLIRGNDEAVVDETITATYENFIANGWSVKLAAKEADTPSDATVEKEVVRATRKAAAKTV